jgi:uncharacterized lipoprotein
MYMAGRIICFLLLTALSGCSMLTKEGRQQRSYEKYVRKSSYTRYKKAVKFRMSKTDMPIRQVPSERTTNTTVSEGPQSVTTGSDAPSGQ